MSNFFQSEKNFRRFEETISSVVSEWPRARFVEPERHNLSVATCAARLRDALRAVTANPAWTTSVDRAKLVSIRRQLVVIPNDETVYIGKLTKDQLATDHISSRPLLDTPTNSQKLVLLTPDVDVTIAACLLLSRRVLNQVTVHAPSKANVEHVNSLTRTYDIAFTQDTDTLTIF